MAPQSDFHPVLAEYPGDCQPRHIERLNPAGSFSGALLWRLQSPRGPLCLRRWPRQSPTPDRLEFIQAVLWHTDQERFHLVPVPVETRAHAGYVRHEGHLWEITPWMPGAADYRAAPSQEKLAAALVTLAKFHRAASTFPLSEARQVAAPGIVERRRRLDELKSGELQELERAIELGDWPELAARSRIILDLFSHVIGRVATLLDSAARWCVDLQPCIRDIWHEHVLFEGTRVTGLVDFGAMRPENVSADIARLLGSLAGDDPQLWKIGLDAYQQVRPLSGVERMLVDAFDQSAVAMSGLQWIDWIYVKGRIFLNRPAVLARLDEIIFRLRKMAMG